MSLKKVPQLFAVLLSLFLGSAPLLSLQAQNDFPLILDRIRTGFTTGTVASLDNAVTSSLSTQAANGSWPDINYADKSQTNWQPGIHWDRISAFARAYSREGSTYNGSDVLRQAIINGMNYWLALSPAPTSTNWYMLSISLPENIGNALVAMRYGSQPLSSELENALIAWMVKGVPITQSPAKDGSNLIEVGQHYIVRACLTQNQALLQQTVSTVANSLVITNNSSGNIGEGLQSDNTFTAHGPQLYLYGYGSELLVGISNIASYVTGTTYAFPADKMAIFSSFVRGSYLKATRGMYHDFNAFNRQISRPNDGKPNQFNVRRAKNVDLPQYAAEYDAAISRINGSQLPSYQVSPEHIHFWRTDYTVHHRPAYMFGLRSVSTRTAKSENGNGENLKGYYMTEGANYIAVNGDEYYNIYPVWEWNKIPGTTVPEITTYPLRTAWGVNFGTSAFAGGVSDGQYGVSTFAMNDYNTTAKKSWFFFDDEVVCLGAGIASSAAEAINTTVNQCLLDGTVNVKTSAGTQALANGNRQYAGSLQWAHHDNVGYFFPQGGTVSLSNQAQSGTQKSINSSYSADLITKDVFKLWFQHGVKPTAGSYAYIVAPGKTLAEMESYNASQIDIWANDATFQAVYHSGKDMLQIVFYQAGSITKNGITVSANGPCALLLKNISSSSIAVSVADPNQVTSSVAVGFQNQALEQLRTFTATMPNGLMAGGSISGIIDINTPVIVGEIPDVLEAAGDAFVRDGIYADINYPTGNLNVKNDNPGFARRAFLQFDLSQYTKSLDSAFLRVRVNSAGATIDNTNWEFYEVPDNSWTETGITWNNQPPVGSNLIAIVQGRAAGNMIYVPVTSTVLSSLAADKKLSIRISSTTLGSTTDVAFAARENTTATFRPALMLYGKVINTLPPTVLEAVGDAFVRDGTANANVNNPTGNLAVKNDAVGFSRRAFLQFDLSQYTMSLDSAYLRVRVNSAGATINTTNWEFYEVPDNTWTETGITWNNQPSIGSNLIATVQGRAAGNIIYVPITTTVLNRLQADKKLSVRISSTTIGSTTDASFASRENTTTAFRPALMLYGTVDNLPPTISAPEKMVKYADQGACTATGVVFNTPEVTDKNGVKSITHDAPAVFPVGNTTVTWTAIDDFGNTATVAQMVEVVDNQLPIISVPVSQSFCSSGNDYQLPVATATDNCGVESISYVITGATERAGAGADASGSFNIGVSTITWTATDMHGNISTGSTLVEVFPSVQVSIPDVYALNPAVDLKNTIYAGYGPTSLTLGAVADGGTPEYNYAWNTGAQTASLSVSTAGTYTVQVTDANNCQATASINIQIVDVQCGNNGDKVMICHNDKAICISQAAVQAHLDHGDNLGSCALRKETNIVSSAASVSVSAKPVTVYPNPVADRLNMVLNTLEPNATGNLYNAMGQRVMTVRISSNQQQVSVKGLAAGTYFLVVINGKEISKMIIVKK